MESCTRALDSCSVNFLVETELRKLDARINEAHKASNLAVQLFTRGSGLSDVATVIKKEYPYGLNSQKPMRELISEIPPDLQRWELEKGGLCRARHIWEPMRRVLKERLGVLTQLEASSER
jgi:hypothetical protein